MPDIYYSQTSQWDDFLAEVSQKCRLYLPKAQDDDYSYQRYKDSDNFSFNSYRPVQPLKSFLIHPKEQLAEIFSSQLSGENSVPTIVTGLKNCDLHSIKIQDFVYKEGVGTDPLYEIRRENTIFISGDCTGFKEVCFCLALEVLPHPTQGFDLNLSPLTDGYIVEVGSVRGKKLIEEFQRYFINANSSQISARDSKRQNLIEELTKHLCSQRLPEKGSLQRIVKQGYNSDAWKKFCMTCVECGACNFICCTCHCFLLSDVQDKKRYSRMRLWDSCQYANFARVAGGANPLKRRWQRLRNRFLKKFDFFVDNLGLPACEGCGRCIEACPGKIDIREVLKELGKNA